MQAVQQLEGKVAIVTGGGNGIGRAYARGLAAAGARVVVSDLDLEAAQKVAAEIEADGGDALAVATDVADEAACADMVSAAVERFGRIDVLVNNAALFNTIPIARGGFEEIEVDEWDRVMTVNVRGTWLPTRAVAPQMREHGSGSVINVSSGTALKGSAGRAHYVASKAAVLGLTRTMARELGKDNIRVNVVAPGSTLSEADPSEDVVKRREAAAASRALARVQTPEDLVGAVVFFASDASSFITGQTLVVDGGSFMH